MTDPADFTACAAWRWLPGMRIHRPDEDVPGRIIEDAESSVWLENDGWWCSAAKNGPFSDLTSLGCTPDLADPATLGAIEHGILAPAGVWIHRSPAWGGSTSFFAYVPGKELGLRTYPTRTTLAAALLDGLRAVTP